MGCRPGVRAVAGHSVSGVHSSHRRYSASHEAGNALLRLCGVGCFDAGGRRTRPVAIVPHLGRSTAEGVDVTAAAVNPHGAASHVHIARQPIYDGDRVFAYELLFRSHAEARIASERGAAATGTIIHNAFAAFGL